jgi:hypothetical protein
VRRFLLGLTALVAFSIPASAHFLYVVPVPEGGFRLVFNDGPRTDDQVSPELFQKASFRLVSASGQPNDVVGKPDGDGRPRIEGEGAMVYGTVPYGVLFRGDANPVFVVYHPKAINTTIRSGETPRPVGMPLELTPVLVDGGVGYLVTQMEKPVAGVDVTVYPPGEAKPKVVKTDTAGRTSGFGKPGEYGVRAYRMNPTAGEYQGRKYTGERHYATLTVKYEPGK